MNKKDKKRFLTVLLVWLMYANIVSAQISVRDSAIRMPMISIGLGGQLPGGNLVNRFGPNGNLNGFFQYKTKTNWLFSIEGSYIFGNIIYEKGIFDSIATKDDNKFIINENGVIAKVELFERGFTFNASVGKIFNYWAPNPNSGITVKFGVGILQHQIRIEGENASTPQIYEKYQYGYDRLTNGLSLTEFIGYTYFGNRRLVNFYAGFEFIQGFTENRRRADYNIMKHDATQRKDLLNGIKIGWIIPLYKKIPKEFYYY